MIGSLRGRLIDRSLDGELLIDVAGVGYRVTTLPATAATRHAGEECFVFVHHHIREDAQTLYGFATKEERLCFEALLGAHGVGPSLALSILTVFSPVELHRTLAADDVDALTKVPGVGKKTATRLIVDLKSRLDLPLVDLAAISERTSGTASAIPAAGAHADVRDALINLGHPPDVIRRVLAELPAEGDASVLVREALRLVGTSAKVAVS